MTTEDMLVTILKTSFVKADMLRRIRLVREYVEQRFFASSEAVAMERSLSAQLGQAPPIRAPASHGEAAKKELEEFLSTSDISDDDKKIIQGYGAEFFRTFTKDNAYDLLSSIDEGLKKLETINFYVPVELDAAATEKLGSWVRENVEKSILIELHTDTSVFGGCSFARKGEYHDYSLHHAFTAHNTEIQGILDGLLKQA